MSGGRSPLHRLRALASQPSEELANRHLVEMGERDSLQRKDAAPAGFDVAHLNSGAESDVGGDLFLSQAPGLSEFAESAGERFG